MNAQRNNKIQRQTDDGDLFQNRLDPLQIAEKSERIQHTRDGDNELEYAGAENGQQVFFRIENTENQNPVFREVGEFLRDGCSGITGNCRDSGRGGSRGSSQLQDGFHLVIYGANDPGIGFRGRQNSRKEKEGQRGNQDAADGDQNDFQTGIGLHVQPPRWV